MTQVRSTKPTSTTKPTTQPKSSDPVLKEGSKGDDVKELQHKLNDMIDKGQIKGDKINEDGNFGDKTKKLLQQAQKALHKSADGVAGTDTGGAMDLKSGKLGDAIKKKKDEAAKGPNANPAAQGNPNDPNSDAGKAKKSEAETAQDVKNAQDDVKAQGENVKKAETDAKKTGEDEGKAREDLRKATDAMGGTQAEKDARYQQALKDPEGFAKEMDRKAHDDHNFMGRAMGMNGPEKHAAEAARGFKSAQDTHHAAQKKLGDAQDRQASAQRGLQRAEAAHNKDLTAVYGNAP